MLLDLLLGETRILTEVLTPNVGPRYPLADRIQPGQSSSAAIIYPNITLRSVPHSYGGGGVIRKRGDHFPKPRFNVYSVYSPRVRGNKSSGNLVPLPSFQFSAGGCVIIATKSSLRVPKRVGNPSFDVPISRNLLEALTRFPSFVMMFSLGALFFTRFRRHVL